LLTFIICFDHERWYRRRPYCAIAAVLVFLSAGGADWLSDAIPALIPSIDAKSFGLNFIQERILYFATMFMVCMVCHGELVRLRPAARHLTEYYLMIAAGGALGGALVSLIAPRIFPGYWEWNIALIVSLAVAGAYWLRSGGARAKSRQTPEISIAAPSKLLVLATIAQPIRALAVTAGLIVVAIWQWQAMTPAAANIHQRRNFYGVVKVYDYQDERGHIRLFKNGGVSHGRQWVSDNPAKRRLATAYYAPETGAGRAIRFFQHKSGMRVGVVGLGVGTLATYGIKSGQTIKFYEINPEVVSIAKGFFTYLKDCDGHAEIALGDARLTLEAEPPQNFDVLVLDAFSGDAPPAHLLTREAFALYRRHLKPDGIIAVNIKNRYVRLAPVVKAAADAEGFRTTRIWTDEDKNRLLYEVDYMLLTNNDEFLKQTPPILAPGDNGQFEP
ncbi:MAG TPA: fused MFS/spermidine synthase, partial [Pirellulales bacterium]|nr:fused MFS/spermidine synthase [Pirellulales bacterium]